MCTEEICIAKDLINVDYVGHDLLSDKSPQIIDSFSSRQERLDYAINLLKNTTPLKADIIYVRHITIQEYLIEKKV